MTRTGLVMGTPGFIAPEIIDGAESDETTDWWSVASVLAFAATGAPVFGTKPMMAVLERAAAGNANLAGLPANTMTAFRAALSPDRSQRCTPEQLLQAIAVDALNPIAWEHVDDEPGDTAGIGAFPTRDAAHTDEGSTPSEVVRPFDANPRVLWRDEDDADIIRTEAMTATAIPDAATPDTVSTSIIGQSAESQTVLLPNTATAPSHTTAMPAEDRPATTAVMPVATQAVAYGQDAWNPGDDAPTAVDPAIRPALQRVIDQSAQTVPDAGATQPPSGMQASAVNAAAIARGMMLKRGIAPLAVCAILLAGLTAIVPYALPPIAAVLFWLFLTLGYSTDAQLEREASRGGVRRGSDVMLRVATFPWHLAKGLVFGVMRAVMHTAIAVALVAIGVLALQLPYDFTDIMVGDTVLSVPMLADLPFSVSGLVAAGGAAVGWLLLVFGPRAQIIRLGAGALRGRPDPATSASTATASAPIR